MVIVHRTRTRKERRSRRGVDQDAEKLCNRKRDNTIRILFSSK
jgi:hypothetical protein